MKKTLIAAAALTAAAGAMAEVTITGVFDTTLRMSSFDNGTTEVKTTQIGRDGSGTSGLYFNAKEDLGDGLTALGFMEIDASPFEGGSVFNGGEKYAGLQGSFGSIKIGSPNTPSLAAQGVRAGLFGTKDGGRASAGGATAPGNTGFIATNTLMGVSLTRFSGSVRYDTPSFSGFSAALNYVPESDDREIAATANVTGTSYAAGDAMPAQGAVVDIGLFYKNGPVNLAVTMYSEDEDLGGASFGTTALTSAAITTARLGSAKASQLTVGFQYNLGFAIFGAGLNQTKLEGGVSDVDIEMTGTNLLATVPLSEALTLGVNFQVLDLKDAETYSQSAVGVNYALSKLTSTYARYVSGTSDLAGDPKATTILVGLMTKF